jgi:hypothetical protein
MQLKNVARVASFRHLGHASGADPGKYIGGQPA